MITIAETTSTRGTVSKRRETVRVLHVISGLFYGGGQRVVLDLLKSLPQAGDIDARLCTLGDCQATPLASHCEVSVPFDGRYNNPRVLLRTARLLRAVIAARDVDILHTHGIDADLIGALAVRGRHTRQICHLHITPPANRKESWKATIRRKLLRSLTSWNGAWFIACSDAVRKQMAEYYGLPLERIVTVRNGIDVAEFDGTAEAADREPSGRVVCGTAARLAPMKGLEHLIQAAGRLREQGIHFEVRIAGKGNQRERLEKLSTSLGIAEHVRFLGHVSDMPAFYRSLDVFVLPSVSTEGLPLVVLEALAMGRPVVATRLAGTPEVLRDGVDGLLVPPADACALAGALAQLCRSPELREQMGTSGRKRVENQFGLARVAREVTEVYKRVLSET